MTAEEIRGIYIRALTEAVDKDGTVSMAFSEWTSFAALEIAAQLAELNANLRHIFNADGFRLANGMSSQDEQRKKMPRLFVDKLD